MPPRPGLVPTSPASSPTSPSTGDRAPAWDMGSLFFPGPQECPLTLPPAIAQSQDLDMPLRNTSHGAMNESRDSVCMCTPSAFLCVTASLHVCEGPPRQRGGCLPAASQRNDVVCAHLVWFGPSRGWRWEPAAPPAAVAVDPCAWLLHGLLRSALRSSSLGSEWHGAIQKNSGAGQGRAWANPGNASSGVQRAAEGRAGAGGLGEPQSSPCRPQREIGKGSAGDR